MNSREIIPVASRVDIAANFDEENTIDNNLNMHGHAITNLGTSTDPYAATNNQRVYDIVNNALSNFYIPTDRITFNSDLNFGSNYIPRSLLIPSLDDHLTNKHYVDNKKFGNSNFNVNSINGNILMNDSVDWNKLANVPTGFAGKTSTLVVDSGIDMGSYKIKTNASSWNNDELVPKSYVDNVTSGVLNPATKTSITTSNASLAPNSTNSTYASIKNVITSSQAVYGKRSQNNTTATDDSEVANVGFVDDVYTELSDRYQYDLLSYPTLLQNVYEPVSRPINKRNPPFFCYCKGWWDATYITDMVIPNTDTKKIYKWIDKTGNAGCFYQNTSTKQPTYNSVSGSLQNYVMRFMRSDNTIMACSGLDFRRLTGDSNKFINFTICMAIKFHTVSAIQTIYNADAGGFMPPTLSLDNRNGSATSGSTVGIGCYVGTANGSCILGTTPGSGNTNVWTPQVNRWYCIIHTGGMYPGDNSSNAGGPFVPRIYGFVQNVWVDDNKWILKNLVSDNTDCNSNFVLGGYSQSNTSQSLDASVKTFLVYNRVLNEAERKAVYNYIREGTSIYADFNWDGN